MDRDGGRNKAVFDLHCLTCNPQVGEQLRPTKATCCFPWQTLNSDNTTLKPLLKTLSSTTTRQHKNTKLDFAEDNWVDRYFTFVLPEPFDDLGIRFWLGRLTKYVGIY